MATPKLPFDNPGRRGIALDDAPGLIAETTRLYDALRCRIVTPDEARAMCAVLSLIRSILQGEDIDRRLATIEASVRKEANSQGRIASNSRVAIQ
ncbi:MAG: hypothetical protein H7X92_02035 [Chitinophagales bacterium]|nr:hypothetical protein [Hyphomicrobiales bacterium]